MGVGVGRPGARWPLPVAPRDRGQGQRRPAAPLPPGPRTVATGPQRDGPRPSLERVVGPEGEVCGPPSPASVQALGSWRGRALGVPREGGHRGRLVKCTSGV